MAFYSESPSTLVTFISDAAKLRFLAANGLGEADLKPLPGVGAYVVSKPKSQLIQAAEDIKLIPNQRYAALLTPNDPIYPQWYTDKISAPSAWDITTGSSGVTVAVIDTGFALSHEDLAGRWAENAGEKGSCGVGCDKSSNGVDDDGNGLVDDWRGWDFLNSDNSPIAGATDPNGAYVSHGTLVAGLVGATGNNAKGVAGPNWGAKILPLQVLGDDGVGYTSEVATAIRYAADQGAKVISLSLGSSNPDQFLRDQISYAIGRGAVVIAAAGNSGCDCMVYPANYQEVVAVGATDQDDNRASFSSYGANLDLVAPGSGTIRTTYWTSTNQTTSYTTGANGTSISTPIVSGAAALLLTSKPGLSADEVTYYLKISADNVSGMGGADRTNQYGDGRLNTHQALVQPFKLGPPLYRLYKRNNDHHFYTFNATERDAAAKNGWTYEGVSYYISSQSGTGLQPVYRLYSRSQDYHFYTMSTTERDNATRIGFAYEGIAFFGGTSPDNGKTPVYRLVNKKGRHLYTIYPLERDNAQFYGWVYEGVAYYAGT
jgi:subtilisin family serine protease